MEGTEHKQLAHQIADAIRDRILEGQLPPGEWLRQKRIAEEYQVSQMPVREALKHLAAEGLVEHLPYRGIRVAQVSLDDAEDLFYCRVSIEGRIAGFAATNLTDDELLTLVEMRKQISRAIRDNEIVEYQKLNGSFHDQIIRGGRRPLLERTLSGLWASFPSMLWPGFRETTHGALRHRFEVDEIEHDAILEALKKRDPEEAERAMRHHIQTSAEMLFETVQADRD